MRPSRVAKLGAMFSHVTCYEDRAAFGQVHIRPGLLAACGFSPLLRSAAPLGHDMVRPASQRQRSKVLCVDGRRREDVGKFVGGLDGTVRSRGLIIGGGAISAAPGARSVPGIPIQSR